MRPRRDHPRGDLILIHWKQLLMPTTPLQTGKHSRHLNISYGNIRHEMRRRGKVSNIGKGVPYGLSAENREHVNYWASLHSSQHQVVFLTVCKAIWMDID